MTPTQAFEHTRTNTTRHIKSTGMRPGEMQGEIASVARAFYQQTYPDFTQDFMLLDPGTNNAMLARAIQNASRSR